MRIVLDRAGRVWLTDIEGSRPITEPGGRWTGACPPSAIRATISGDAAGPSSTRTETCGSPAAGTGWSDCARRPPPARPAAPLLEYRATDGLTSDTTRTIFEDREGNIWVGTALGLDRFRNANVAAEPVLTKPAAYGDILFADSGGDVYIGERDTVLPGPARRRPRTRADRHRRAGGHLRRPRTGHLGRTLERDRHSARRASAARRASGRPRGRRSRLRPGPGRSVLDDGHRERNVPAHRRRLEEFPGATALPLLSHPDDPRQQRGTLDDVGQGPGRSPRRPGSGLRQRAAERDTGRTADHHPGRGRAVAGQRSRHRPDRTGQALVRDDRSDSGARAGDGRGPDRGRRDLDFRRGRDQPDHDRRHRARLPRPQRSRPCPDVRVPRRPAGCPRPRPEPGIGSRRRRPAMGGDRCRHGLDRSRPALVQSDAAEGGDRFAGRGQPALPRSRVAAPAGGDLQRDDRLCRAQPRHAGTGAGALPARRPGQRLDRSRHAPAGLLHQPAARPLPVPGDRRQ